MFKTLEQIDNDTDFNKIIYDIKFNDTVLQMKDYRQHYNTSCYEHCIYVSYYTYLLCKKLHLDYISGARASMLHDLFLYDWRKKENRKGFHAFTHPKSALENASKIFKLNDIEKDIILKHMWPVTLALPRYKESYIITFTDKFSAILETLEGLEKTKTYNRIFRYAYMFLGICTFSYFL